MIGDEKEEERREMNSMHSIPVLSSERCAQHSGYRSELGKTILPCLQTGRRSF